MYFQQVHSNSFDQFINSLADGLRDLPGWQAQYQMSPQFRMKPDEAAPYYKDARLGGVLILFYPHNETINTVLIQRPTYQGVHSGQIAFPGGRKEEQDADLITTALREAEEEVNVASQRVTVLNSLTELYIPPSNFLVTPVVGYTTERPNFKPEEREVESILEVPVAELTDKKIRGVKEITPREGVTFHSPYYNVQGKTVWGATAMMISELNAVLELMHR